MMNFLSSFIHTISYFLWIAIYLFIRSNIYILNACRAGVVFVKVGSFYKIPLFPIWVVGSTSHFSVLFSADR